METRAAAEAKRFFLAALEDQAVHDGVQLLEIEREMFLFSEGSDPEKAGSLAERFDAECDADAYEAKIAGLLRKAHRRDSEVPSRAHLWNESLRALEGEDFYGMVMLGEAGLRLPDLSPGLLDCGRLPDGSGSQRRSAAGASHARTNSMDLATSARLLSGLYSYSTAM